MDRNGFGGLDISLKQPSPGVVSITVAGELDISNRDRLSDVLGNARDGAAKLIVDLRGLSFMDSSGLRLLLDTWNECSMNDRVLQIVVSKEGLVRRVLEISGCDRILPVSEQPDVL